MSKASVAGTRRWPLLDPASPATSNACWRSHVRVTAALPRGAGAAGDDLLPAERLDDLLHHAEHTLGIKAGPHGADRSFYSLRHTAITFRLIFGGNIDLLTLARNALAITLQCAAYNARRLVWLVKSAGASARPA